MLFHWVLAGALAHASPAPPPPERQLRLTRAVRYLLDSVDGNGVHKPLTHVDGSQRPPDSLESGNVLVWKWCY